MKKKLAYFRSLDRQNIAVLDGLKTIMRVTTPRKYEFWLVLPAIGENDSVCVFLEKAPRWELLANVQENLLMSYGERITKILCTYNRSNFPHL